MDRAAVSPNAPLPEEGVVGRHRLHLGDDSRAVARLFFLRRQSELSGLAFQVGEIGLGVSAEATLERAGLAPLVEASADRLPARAIDAPKIACARRRQPGRRARNQAHRAAHHGPGRGGLATAGPPLVIAARAEELLETI